MKKSYKVLVLLLVLASLYLYLAHAYIYHRIGQGGLKAADVGASFLVGSTSPETLIYTPLGDSLTAGVGAGDYQNSYPYRLAQDLAGNDKKILLKNFSYPGARTGDLIRDLLGPAIAQKPDIITLLIGTNDVHGAVSSRQFEKNYDYILAQLTRKTRARIYVIDLPSIGSDSLVWPPFNFYYDWKTEKFNGIIKKLAGKYRVGYVDLDAPTYQLLKKDGPYYAVDSFHPSAAGYALWARLIYASIHQ